MSAAEESAAPEATGPAETAGETPAEDGKTILASGSLPGGVKSRNNPGALKWHQLARLEKQEPVEREFEGEKIFVTPLALKAYAETVLPNGMWCKHASEWGMLAAGIADEKELDTAKWNDPYKKHKESGYKDAFANKRDKEKDPAYKAICLHHTNTDDLGKALGKLVGVGRKHSAAYCIDREGTIFELFDPEEHWAEHGGVNDNRAIAVQLVNKGPLAADDPEAGKGYTHDSDWRGKSLFQHFTREQNDAVVRLLRYLCARFKIPPRFFDADPKAINEYLESKAERDTLMGIYAHSNVKKTGVFDVGPAFAWSYVVEEVQKPAPIDSTAPRATPTGRPLGTGKFEWPLELEKLWEAASTKDGLQQRGIAGEDPYSDFARIARRVGVDTGEWNPLEDGIKPPWGPFPMFASGSFNPGLDLGLPKEWGEIAGKVEVRAIGDGEVVARGGEVETVPGTHEVGFVIVKHRVGPPADAPGLKNPRWLKPPLRAGAEAEAEIDAPKLDGRTVKFIFERAGSEGWQRLGEPTAPVASEKASVKFTVPDGEPGSIRFRAELEGPKVEVEEPVFYALYANLVGMDSTTGDVVAAGDYLGKVGAHPHFPHLHLAIASATRFPAEGNDADGKPIAQVLGDHMTQDEVLELGAAGRDRAWGLARVQCTEPPKMFQLAGLTGAIFLYNPIHFVRWLRKEKIDLAIATPAVPGEVEERPLATHAGIAHPPVAMLQCKPFLEEPAIQRFFARTVVQALTELDRDEDMLVEGCESRDEDTKKCVVALQKALTALGAYPSAADGVYGEPLKTAVNSFETAHKEVMTYSDGTQLEPNGDTDWVTLKAIDAALYAIETRSEHVSLVRFETPPSRPESAPAASPPVIKEGDKIVLPEKFVYMDGRRELAIADVPGFGALKTLPPRTQLYVYLQEGKHEFARLLFDGTEKHHWGPAKVGTLSPYDYLLAHGEEIGVPADAMNVMLAVSQNEGRLDAINASDRGLISFGMFLWPLATGELITLLGRLREADGGVFATYFGDHGLTVEILEDETVDLFLDEKRIANSAKPGRGREGELRKLLTLEWAYLFHAAGRDPKVQETQAKFGLERFHDFYDSPKVEIDGKRVKDLFDSQLGVALLYDLHVNRPTRVKAALQQAVKGFKAGSSVEYDKADQGHQNLLAWHLVAARCESRMWDPWNRADRILAVADKREPKQVGTPAPGTTTNWDALWKETWAKEENWLGMYKDATEKYWRFLLPREPASFTLPPK